MTTHLSVRLAWHDRGWDGCVCDNPHLNSSCTVQEHIRESRDDEKEKVSAGAVIADLKSWVPPCSRDIGAYSERGYRLRHTDPLDFRALPAVAEEVPPFSCCPSPYRWMREESFREICDAENINVNGPELQKEYGWVYEPERQRELLKHFWKKLEPKKSLVFYYCNHGNPLDENSPRIIVGVGRINAIGPQLYFGTKEGYYDHYPIWARHVVQDYPSQGVKLPYQQYLAQGKSVENIICRVPQSAFLDFSYVGEHVSDDVAVAVLERIIQSVEQVRNEGIAVGDWDKALTWLDEVLAEVWTERGAFPGLGSVLNYLGFEKGFAYQRMILAPLAKKNINPLDVVLDILEGRTEPEENNFKQGLLKARSRWTLLKGKHELLAKLTRFELSSTQVERIANADFRVRCGINATEKELVANPFIIAEADKGMADSEPVALETIDHGMRPEGAAGRFPDTDTVSQDDSRRVRAVAHAVLTESAASGDTVLSFEQLMEKVATRFPERRTCKPDREVVIAEREFYNQVLWTDFEGEPKLTALKWLYDMERGMAGLFKRRAGKENDLSQFQLDWKQALVDNFGLPKNEREGTALVEKARALEVLAKQRISVLTGGAGTGKTSVLKVFLNEMEKAEGKIKFHLLAPTGKARVRLSTATRRNAMTIHQFLLKQGWFVPDTFQLRETSQKEPEKVNTVIIDECSMIPTDLIAVLLKAIDMNFLKRLILVGDPFQLPPIGPGRPFVDLVNWLRENQPKCLAELAICMRTELADEDGRKESTALTFADGYRGTEPHPADDEILAAIARGEKCGDLEAYFWNDHNDLMTKLKEAMYSHMGIKPGDYMSFNESLGITNKQWKKAEAWQILSPTRIEASGTDELNRLLQKEFRSGLIAMGRSGRKGIPEPFGSQEIVSCDKVLQIVNTGKRAWPPDVGLNYVANGEIGILSRTHKEGEGKYRKKKKDYVDVVFSTQDSVSYRYYRGEVDENLELAYALTVHKAQGSDFEVVFLVIPQKAGTLSRELIYTGLTRFTKRLVLLIEKDIDPLIRLRNPQYADVHMRSTFMFDLLLKPEGVHRPYEENLIHRTKKGVLVRSKSEVIVAGILDGIGASWDYEVPLYAKNSDRDFRLPDFTVSFEGDTYYWEHLGMLSLPEYRQGWERKLQWYKNNGYEDRLIISQDGPDGSIDEAEIERIAREKILGE